MNSPSTTLVTIRQLIDGHPILWPCVGILVGFLAAYLIVWGLSLKRFNYQKR